LFELLLESGELGKWRVGVRLLVAAAGAASERLGVILLAIGTFDTVAALAARPVPPRTAILSVGAFGLPLFPLLPLLSVLTLLPIWPFVAIIGWAVRAG
jgi:hypothetical protein